MKLQMTLPEKPAFVHTLPFFDLLTLLLVCVLIGPTFMADAGIEVDHPTTTEQLRRFGDPIIVTVSAGDDPAVFLNGQRTSLQQLAAGLTDAIAGERWNLGDAVLIKADRAVVVGVQNQVISTVRKVGLRPAIAYRSERD